MKKPIITLKNIKMFRGHDGVGLDCDLYVDGKKVAHVFDSAHGGENEYQPYGSSPDEFKANRKILEELEVYAKTLPPNKYPDSLGGKEYPQELGDIINNILNDIEKEKLARKMVKKFDTHIITGVPNGDSVREYSYGKPKIELRTLLVAKLQADINAIKAKLKEGEQILNTNLAALGIK